MEFQHIVVKTATLNRAYFKQLEKVTNSMFTGIPVINGWVNDDGREWFIASKDNTMVRISYADMWDIYVNAKPEARQMSMATLRDAFYKFQHTYPQIFI